VNLTIYRQRQDIERLQLQMAQLRQQLQDSGGPAAQRDLRGEIPPHY